MTAIIFDTHDFVKKLKNVGFSEEQAEVITELQKTTISGTLEQAKHEYQLDELMTKRDLKEIDLKFELIRSDLKRDVAETKADLVRWVVGVGILQSVLITGLMLNWPPIFKRCCG